MTYSKQTWADTPATTSPISAARLGHMEDGIEAAHALPGLFHMGTFTTLNALAETSYPAMQVDGVFTPPYERYRVLIDGEANGGSNFKWIFSAGGVYNEDHGNTDYRGFQVGSQWGVLDAAPPAAQRLDADQGSYKWVPMQTGEIFNCTLDVWYPAHARAKQYQSQGQSTTWGTDFAADGEQLLLNCGGYMSSSSIFDGMVLYCSASNLTRLTVAVYAYA
jgi:hypothetical protein